MSHRAGEATWFTNPAFKWAKEEHQKPWIFNGSPLLAEAGAIMALLPAAPARVLDAGCAGGHLTNILSLCGYEVFGVDVCADAIDGAAAGYVQWNGLKSKAQFDLSDFDHILCSDGEFDAVVFASSLHHSVSIGCTLRETFRVLKPGGLLIASEPGALHELGSNCKQWARELDVTEKATPPYRIIWHAWKIGFRNPKIYPNPVTLHKAVYCRRELSNHPLAAFAARFPMIASLLFLGKWAHGLTTLIKPRAEAEPRFR